jgi:hypothetical protein
LGRVFDPNPAIAFHLGRGLTIANPGLPSALAGVERRAQFVLEIDQPLLVDAGGLAHWDGMGAHLEVIAAAAALVMSEVSNQLDQVSIALRLWAGCVLAAKVIAFETRSGANTPEGRSQAFGVIDAIAETDAIFRAGVEAAPAFKRARAQAYDLTGVPDDSAVRRFAVND